MWCLPAVAWRRTDRNDEKLQPAQAAWDHSTLSSMCCCTRCLSGLPLFPVTVSPGSLGAPLLPCPSPLEGVPLAATKAVLSPWWSMCCATACAHVLPDTAAASASSFLSHRLTPMPLQQAEGTACSPGHLQSPYIVFLSWGICDVSKKITGE